MKTKNQKSNEAGNILIYILGAIFLLGLLVVMVKGSSTPGSNIDKETLLLRVSEIQQYGEELERSVAFIMRNGHSEVDIRFAHPDANSAYGLITNIPTRQIFSREGGGAAYRPPPNNIQITPTDWIFSGENAVGTIGSGACATDSCADLIALLMNVNQAFCIALNKKSGLENPLDIPPQDDGNIATGTPFVGTYQRVQYIDDTANLYISNNNEGCFQAGGGGDRQRLSLLPRFIGAIDTYYRLIINGKRYPRTHSIVRSRNSLL